MTGSEGLCSCEQAKHGEMGPVVATERIARVVVSPQHFLKDGSIKPGVFPIGHIEEKGLSLLRVDKMSGGDIHKQATAIAGDPAKQKPAGALVCTADTLRGLQSETADGTIQALCLLDDPVIGDKQLPDNPAHAFAVRSLGRDRPETLRLQLELVNIFGSMMAVADI
ncbi:hypothetical protein NKH95_25790 [Mesorhizobium sp. M0848]|uniref:hypothetical protein n=1 Tax=Mesorhizobium sp. M0848 TaxID=2957012 RepID=UPI0033367CA1